jgi:hypothetical protein
MDSPSPDGGVHLYESFVTREGIAFPTKRGRMNCCAGMPLTVTLI